MLEHGTPEAAAFLEQLERARVVGKCPCCCANSQRGEALASPARGLLDQEDQPASLRGRLDDYFLAMEPVRQA